MVERIDLLARVRAANPEVELLALDYSVGSLDMEALRTPELSADDRDAVLGTLKTYQRVHVLAHDPADAAALLEAGYTSATAVVADGRDTLDDGWPHQGQRQAGPRQRDRDLRGRDGVARHGDRPRRRRHQVVGGGQPRSVGRGPPAAPGRLRDPVRDPDSLPLRALPVDPVAGRLLRRPDELRRAPASYSRSSARPRADSALQPEGAPTGPVDAAAHVPRTPRRSVPTLEIVNQVLEDRVALDGGFAGPLTDRRAVERTVYRDTLSDGAQIRFRQPFWLPLERLRDLSWPLRGDTRPGSPARSAPRAPVQAAAALGVSTREVDLIAQRRDARSVLHAASTACPFQIDAGGAVTAFDAQRLLAPMDVSRDELGTLLGDTLRPGRRPGDRDPRGDGRAPTASRTTSSGSTG